MPLPARLNPPFDPRIRKIGDPALRKLSRGTVHHAPDNASGVYGRVDFMYNPTTVTVNHTTDFTQINAGAGDPSQGADAAATGTGVGIGDVNFDLYFDRTFEVWAGKKTSVAHKYGVYGDVLAFYHLLGMTKETADSTSATKQLIQSLTSVGPVSGGSWFSRYPMSPMKPTNVYVRIGGGVESGKVNDRIKYYGQISSLSVQYTHWSTAMIPIRCVVSLGLLVQSDPNVNSIKMPKGTTPSLGGPSASAPATSLGGLLGAP